MRILHVVHQYMPDHVGGTELYAQTLARHQLQLNHSVAIFSPSPTTPVPNNLQPQEEEGVRVYRARIGPLNRTQIFRNTFGNKSLDEAFATVLEQENPNIIHIQHLMGLPLSLFNHIESAGIPYVITLHDYWYGCANAQLITNDTGEICAGPNKGYKNCARCAIARAEKENLSWLSPTISPLMAYRNNRLQRILTQAKQVIAPTHFTKNIYKQMGIPTDNMVVIPHGIDIPHQKIETVLKERLVPPKNTLHIGYIGSIAKQKGIHILISAVNQLPENGVKLTIYGGLKSFPDYTAHLKEIAQHPGIHFAGRIARDEIWEAFASFDIMAMPTLWYEVSPLTIQEAFAVKTPIIASRIGAMPEKITDGVDGLLVPPGDIVALHTALLSLKDNPNLLGQLRAGIQPVYTMTEQVKDINNIYKKYVTEFNEKKSM